MIRLLFTALALVLSTNAYPDTLKAWKDWVVFSDSKLTMAYTSDQDAKLVLAMNNQCNILPLRILKAGPPAAAQSVQPAAGELLIDNGKNWQWTGRAIQAQGKSQASIEFLSINLNSMVDLSNEMRSGNFMWVNYLIAQQSLQQFRFSLNGYTAAARDLYQTCKSNMAKRN
ncbi:MAG: hypothetical protein ACSHXK_10610 [Oceanococcus sp.]